LVPKILDPFGRLSEIMGNITCDEKTERKSERWLLERAEARLKKTKAGNMKLNSEE